MADEDVRMVTVKWNDQKFKDVELDMNQPPTVFMAQLFALTGVPPARQKIMGVKGGTLKEDGVWSELGIKKKNHKFMLIGEAEDRLPEPPKEQIVFIEDMTEAEAAQLNAINPPGLKNLGNTCYLNATLQCFKSMPEMVPLLEAVGNGGGPNEGLAIQLKLLLEQMASTGQTVTPAIFLLTFHQLFPHFAEPAPNGNGYKQQDAEEAWGALVNTVAQVLPDASVDSFLAGEYLHKLSCDENPEEEPTYTNERFFTLSCNITNQVNYLTEGLRLALRGQIEKQSSSLARSALYTKSSTISRLPAYLTVQFVRFYWKQSSQSKAKILRNVKFPLELDVYDMCSPTLQAYLDVARRDKMDLHEAEADRMIGTSTATATATATTTTTTASTGDDDNNGDVAPMATDGTDAADTGAGDEAKTPPVEIPFGSAFAVDNLPEHGFSTTGLYKLQAVLTHIGRSADSGHYIAWVRMNDEIWLKFDDNKVTEVPVSEILALSGGGDWHTAYICVYKSADPPADCVVGAADAAAAGDEPTSTT